MPFLLPKALRFSNEKTRNDKGQQPTKRQEKLEKAIFI